MSNQSTAADGTVEWTNTPRTYPTFEGDVGALEADLRREVRGEVRFDSGSKAIYSTDASNYRQVPIGVVLPKDNDDMVETVRVCRKHGAPITHRGGGTSLAGQCVNTAVVIDCSKYLGRILEIDPERKRARIEPGVIRDQLVDATSEYGLTFGPDTSTHEYATFGGMIGNNSCGAHSQMAGRTEDNVEELEILTYDGHRMCVGATGEEQLEAIIREGGRKGEIYKDLRNLRDEYADLIRERYPDIPRRISGYNLTQLLPENGFNVARALVGSEGTCITILEATVRLVDNPPKRSLLVVGYPTIYEAGDHVQRIGEMGAIGLEGMDRKLVEHMEEKRLHAEYLPLLPEGDGWLLVEFGGETQKQANEQAWACMEELRSNGASLDFALVDDPEEQEQMWAIREAGLAATSQFRSQDNWPGWEDSAVPPEQLGEYLRELRQLYAKFDYDGALYGHFGQGCVHTRINFDLRSEEGVGTFRRFMDEAAELCIKYGGSLSAEHGDGQARSELLPKMFGEELVEAFRTFKEAWDPDWKMNPGKVVAPYRLDENLRLGTDYDPPELETHFGFPEDDGSFARAARRCVGVGKCRRLDMPNDETMCPSFLATREEMHTTRGRARLLFEMLNGKETPGAWKNDDVFEALDLCLSCKGCKTDCPVNVDMATYKAEFLSHYYEGRLRPRSAYAFGLIYWWARLASLMPGVANFFTHTPGLRDIVKAIGGVAPEREMPAFAPTTLRQWFAGRGGKNEGKPTILLWPDTFTNFFKPETGKAAVEVLEEAGYEVTLPEVMLCCGRPLYEFGWVERARSLLRQILEALREEIRAGTPVVGLEPSCVVTFRDELLNLFPHDEDAKRLSEQVFTLGQFLRGEVEGYEPPELPRKAVLHGHCHHKSVVGIDHEQKLLNEMGLEVEMSKSSCCGMAGPFGFEVEHYDVAMACGEHRLLPDVRAASPETLIIADGFSCREQVAHATDRHPMHLAEVLHLAHFANGEAEAYPERRYGGAMRSSMNRRASNARRTGLLAAGAVAAGAGLTWLLRRE